MKDRRALSARRSCRRRSRPKYYLFLIWLMTSFVPCSHAQKTSMLPMAFSRTIVFFIASSSSRRAMLSFSLHWGCAPFRLSSESAQVRTQVPRSSRMIPVTLACILSSREYMSTIRTAFFPGS